jgi:catechol 2,3-dioxygenase-like lactoylglutathione lyase family enzyme
MQMKLELVPIPVADVDRAKSFYAEKLGFKVDHDTRISDTLRVVQLTPTGSACSIVLSIGLAEIAKMPPGSIKALHLVVASVAQARDLLVSQGVAVSDIEDHGRGVKSVSFSDPDGNSWVFQEMSWRSAEFESV